jgi:hypothetical protein
MIRSVSNVHRQGAKKNIFLFSTPRSGSTWLMEILSSQPGTKYYDEPFNIRRDNVIKAGLFKDYASLMPEGGQESEILKFLERLRNNHFSFMNPPPFRKNHWFLTSRIVFKIHELEHMIGRIQRYFDAHVVYLLRHPIPTTLSRFQLPRIDMFVSSSYYRERFLAKEQHSESVKLLRDGSQFQRGILSWCFENLVLLQPADDADWTVVTYEELVLNTAKWCDRLCRDLDMTNRKRMLASAGEPSANINLSDADTQRIVTDSDNFDSKRSLVTKWAPRVTEEQLDQAYEILALFGFDAYPRGSFVAADRYLKFDDTIAILEGT